jgi:hypothetical protein
VFANRAVFVSKICARVVLGTAQNPADPTKPVRINRIITGILIFKILFLAVLFVRSSIRIVGKH